MNIFEVIPNQQTPKVQHITDITLYLKMQGLILQEFLDSCYMRYNAAGLACNQVNFNGDRFMVRAFAYKDSSNKLWKLAIDPIIEEYIGMKEIKVEGCLTWKGKLIVAERSRAVKVSYYDLLGNCYFDEFHKGFDAQVWQHEINHLDGIEEQIEEYDHINKIPKRKDIGRNDPCPCNSGKKYKNCCLLYL